jgi:hypothetical protein
LDVAVGSVEMMKYLLEFHSARPTRETLKQSISTANLELIKLMRERLPEEELLYEVRGRMGFGATPVFAKPGCHIVPSDILAKGIVTIDADKGRNMNLVNLGYPRDRIGFCCFGTVRFPLCVGNIWRASGA